MIMELAVSGSQTFGTSFKDVLKLKRHLNPTRPRVCGVQMTRILDNIGDSSYIYTRCFRLPERSTSYAEAPLIINLSGRCTPRRHLEHKGDGHVVRVFR